MVRSDPVNDVGGVVGAISACVCVVVWLVRLEGRVNTHSTELSSVKDDLRYIRDRIDRALNGRH
jgi:hypothetical protein